MNADKYLDEAANLAIKGIQNGEGGPFGAVVVRGNLIIGRGCNQTTKNCDPTAHAEIQAIRDACTQLQTIELTDTIIYCSSEPCPMCMAAIYWAKIGTVYFANTKEDAAALGFDDSFVYQELSLPWQQRSLNILHLSNQLASESFRLWDTAWQTGPK